MNHNHELSSSASISFEDIISQTSISKQQSIYLNEKAKKLEQYWDQLHEHKQSFGAQIHQNRKKHLRQQMKIKEVYLAEKIKIQERYTLELAKMEFKNLFDLERFKVKGPSTTQKEIQTQNNHEIPQKQRLNNQLKSKQELLEESILLIKKIYNEEKERSKVTLKQTSLALVHRRFLRQTTSNFNMTYRFFRQLFVKIHQSSE